MLGIKNTHANSYFNTVTSILSDEIMRNVTFC